MTSRFLLVLLASSPLAVWAAPVPKEDEAAKLRRVYGTWTDPDRDCRFVLKGGELRVSIPATDHLVGVNRNEGKNNAPRVLREVEGDFTAVVRVSFPVPESVPESVLNKKFWPNCSGGIIAWESDKAYLLASRCGGFVNGHKEAIWSIQTTGTAGTFRGRGAGKPAGSAFVRLKREGDKVIVGWSRDGTAWNDFDPADVAWGAKVKVGVVAENCLGTPVEITFDEYSLTQPKK